MLSETKSAEGNFRTFWSANMEITELEFMLQQSLVSYAIFSILVRQFCYTVERKQYFYRDKWLNGNCLSATPTGIVENMLSRYQEFVFPA